MITIPAEEGSAEGQHTGWLEGRRGQGGDEWRGHSGREREQEKDEDVYECVKLLAQEETWTKTQHSVVRAQGL